LLTFSLFGKEYDITCNRLYTNKAEFGYISGDFLKRACKLNIVVKKIDDSYIYLSSMRFLAQIIDDIEEEIDTIYAVDAKTNRLIDAKKAFFVINSKIKSPYEKYPKIAFKNEDDAKEFIKKYKGDIRDFDFTLFVAIKDLPNDIKFLNKRWMWRYQKGKRIYDLICKKTKVKKYKSANEIKEFIKKEKICINIDENRLNLVALYLLNKESFRKKNLNHIHTPKDAKCPVCGMFVYKYPKWAAMIKTKSNELYFDGVKDMLKFYFIPNRYGKQYSLKNIVDMKVSDYYTKEAIEAKKAFYGVGSNVYGPMGNELIPFKSLEDAKVFSYDHNGKKIYKFDELNKYIVYGLDGIEVE
jgi:nitrous oxide reductase accessory protein NosL